MYFSNCHYYFSIRLIISVIFCNFAVCVVCQEFQDGQGENEKIAKLETWSFRSCTLKPVSCSLVLKEKLKETGKGCLKRAEILYCAVWDIPEPFLCLRRVKIQILLQEKQRADFGVCCSVSRAHSMLLDLVGKTGNGKQLYHCWQFSPKM